MIRKALLGDWEGVKALWYRLKEGRHSSRIMGALGALENYYATSLTDARVAFPILIGDDGVVHGMAVVHDAVSMDLDEGRGLTPNKVAFIRMIYLEPGTGKLSSLEMKYWLNGWAKARGAVAIQGYCNLDFPLQAYERLHGIKPICYLVGKEVE